MTATAEYNRDHYDQLAGEREEAVGCAVEQRRAWLDENADRAAALLAAEREATTDDHLALRDELADRLGSSEALLGRDTQGLDLATRVPEMLPEPPPVDMGLDLDFGP